MPRPALLLSLMLLGSAGSCLAGCGSKPADPAAGKAAGGEVLPGTISDAMINVDQSRVQAPVEPQRVTGKTADDFLGAAPSDAASDAPARPDDQPAPPQ